MPSSDDEFVAWRHRREDRLNAHPELRSMPAGGPARAWYKADEFLVLDEFATVVEAVLRDGGYGPSSGGYEQLVPGVRRYRAAGVPMADCIAEVNRRAVRPADPGAQPVPVIGPNHVFLGTPFYHGGPAGPPSPAPPAHLSVGPRRAPVASIAMLDTGVWRDSPLPREQYEADESDYEIATDVDRDGILDGDVGHANFVAGVILARTTEVRLRIVKVMDTLGVCTEERLIMALARLDPEINVINLSLGGFTTDGEPPVGLRFALTVALTGRDRVLVAAAGNDSNSTDPFWPAAFAGGGEIFSGQVASVAAHDGQKRCEWSNSGDWVTLIAPGQNMVSTFINHHPFDTGWAVWSGTSFATPCVSAAIAERVRTDRSATRALRHVRDVAARDPIDGYPGLR